MDYRVGELASAAGVSVDTIRFYQGRGLIPQPRRQGRTAVYTDDHLNALRRVRSLLKQGFTLAQIRRLAAPSAGGAAAEAAAAPLLEALVEQSVGERTFTRAELAREAGVPEALIGAAIAAGLVDPLVIDGEERFSDADLDMARAGLSILEAGFPLNELLDLAVTHARNVRDAADRGIDLFDEHVRKAEGASDDALAITTAFQTLLPQVTRLVALHFQRTLVNRALERLRASGESHALEQALDATKADLEVACAWR